MADGTIRETLVFDYAQALSAVNALAGESHRAAESQRELAQAARLSESSLRRLEELAVGSSAERAALAYQRQAAEIQRLAEVTGNHALAERAMATLNAEAAQRLQVTTAATQDLGRAHVDSAQAATRATVSHAQLSAGLGNLGAQAADVAVSLASGASPAMVLVQQGPQIAGAVTQIGGLGAAFRALAPLAAAAAPVVAGLALAIAAAGSAYVIWSDVTTTATSEATAQSQALIAQAGAAGKSAEKVRELADAWSAYLSISRDVSERTALINGTLTEGQRQAGATARQIDTAAASTIQAQAREVAELTAALQAAQALSTDQGASVVDRAGASGQLASLQARLDAAREALSATRAQVAADKAGAEALGEYADAERQATEFLRQREAAAEAARKAAEKAAQEARQQAEQQRRLMADVLDAARMQAEGMYRPDTGAQEGLAYLRMVRAELDGAVGDERANALALITEGIAKWPEYAEAFRTIIEETSFPDARRTLEQTAATATGWVGAVSSGPEATMGAIGAATGPIGALVVGIIQAVKDLEGTIASFQAYHADIMGVVGRLPEILANSLQDALVATVQETLGAVVGFVQSLAENLDDILMGFVEAFPQVVTAILRAVLTDIPAAVGDLVKAFLNPQMWGDLVSAIWEGWGQIIQVAFTEAWQSLGNVFEGFLEALRDIFTVFDEGPFPEGGPSSAGDFFGDVFMGPNRQGVLSDIWQGGEGNGGLKGAGNWIAGLFSSRDANSDAAAMATRTTRETASTSRTRRSGVTVNVGHAYGGQAGLREIADLIQTDAAISRYGAWGT